MNTWVEIQDEEKLPGGNGYHICFQNVTYHYDDGSTEDGYRFIWRKPNGNLMPSRGQARIPDAVTLNRLVKKAKSKGWFK
ncbi:MAG: hypothetical protein JWR26_1394 [Pedosphaera sp.]|nr:hypothetical protein [Pedosphaera sp.]